MGSEMAGKRQNIGVSGGKTPKKFTGHPFRSQGKIRQESSALESRPAPVSELNEGIGQESEEPVPEYPVPRDITVEEIKELPPEVLRLWQARIKRTVEILKTME